MNYPLKERTTFTDQTTAYGFIKLIGKLNHHIVVDYGKDDTQESEPFFVDTINDPFRTKDELLKLANII